MNENTCQLIFLHSADWQSVKFASINDLKVGYQDFKDIFPREPSKQASTHLIEYREFFRYA